MTFATYDAISREKQAILVPGFGREPRNLFLWFPE